MPTCTFVLSYIPRIISDYDCINLYIDYNLNRQRLRYKGRYLPIFIDAEVYKRRGRVTPHDDGQEVGCEGRRQKAVVA